MRISRKRSKSEEEGQREDSAKINALTRVLGHPLYPYPGWGEGAATPEDR